MREAIVIAKRDFLERVRSKWFVVMTIVWPLIMVGTIVAPALLADAGVEGARVDIIDRSGKLGTQLVVALGAGELHWQAAVVPPTTTEDEELARLRHKQINGFVLIPRDAIHGGEIQYEGDNASNSVVEVSIQRAITRTVIEARAAEAHVPPSVLADMFGEVKVTTKHTTGRTGAMPGLQTLVLGYILAFFLYIAIALYGVNVMRSVVTEKSSRVVELLVAAAKPRALMAGKIVGVGSAGLAQLLIWLVVGAIALANRDAILSALGAHAAAGGSVLPALTASQVGIALAFFVLGYAFYAALFAAVGATISSEQDTQQAQMPITMLLLIGIVMMQAVTNDARGHTAVVMTLVPFWSPMLMPLRYFLGGANAGDLALSLGILAASTVVVTRAAAKIYRVGILMYGKRPGVRELVRWLKY